MEEDEERDELLVVVLRGVMVMSSGLLSAHEVWLTQLWMRSAMFWETMDREEDNRLDGVTRHTTDCAWLRARPPRSPFACVKGCELALGLACTEILSSRSLGSEASPASLKRRTALRMMAP